MKKILLALAITSMLFITGISTAVPANCTFENELPILDNKKSQSAGWQNFIKSHGIIIWAKGWGNLDGKVINSPYCKFIEGDLGSETWIADISASDDYKTYYTTNHFNYSLYDDAAETRMSSLTYFPIPGYWILFILLMGAKPSALEKFRRNSKIPFLGTGPHELLNGLIFNGTIAKGKDLLTGEEVLPKPVDTDGDGVEDTICYYYEVIARSSSLSHINGNLNISKEDFLKEALRRYLFWNDPNYIPFDI